MKKPTIKIIVLLSFILLVVCIWFSLMYLHAYRRSHFPSWITLVKHPQYERATWLIKGKEYELDACPPIPGYIIEVKSCDEIQIKEKLGMGLYIQYDDVGHFFSGSKLRFMNYTISEIASDSPIKLEYHYY